MKNYSLFIVNFSLDERHKQNRGTCSILTEAAPPPRRGRAAGMKNEQLKMKNCSLFIIHYSLFAEGA